MANVYDDYSSSEAEVAATLGLMVQGGGPSVTLEVHTRAVQSELAEREKHIEQEKEIDAGQTYQSVLHAEEIEKSATHEETMQVEHVEAYAQESQEGEGQT